MTVLTWQIRKNLENSLLEFLQDLADDITVFYKGTNHSLDVRVGRTIRDDWKLPNISLYLDTRTAPRGFIGNNRRLVSYLMIIDVRAFDDGTRSDLAEWVTEVINNGFAVYDYQPNTGDPDNPIKTLFGRASVVFVNDTILNSGTDANAFDKHRHNISISVTIAI